MLAAKKRKVYFGLPVAPYVSPGGRATLELPSGDVEMLCSEHCLPSRILVSKSEMVILLLGLTLQWRLDSPTHRVPHCTCLSDSSVPRGLPDTQH